MTDHLHQGKHREGHNAKKSGAGNPAESAKHLNPAQPKGYDPSQSQHPKHPGYNPAHPQGRNPKIVRAKIALQHTHKHGRGEG